MSGKFTPAQIEAHRRFLMHWTAAGYGARYDKAPWRALDAESVAAIRAGDTAALDAVVARASALRVAQGGKEPVE